MSDGHARGTAQLPAGDVITLLLAQHTRIRELFRQLRDASGARCGPAEARRRPH